MNLLTTKVSRMFKLSITEMLIIYAMLPINIFLMTVLRSLEIIISELPHFCFSGHKKHPDLSLI